MALPKLLKPTSQMGAEGGVPPEGKGNAAEKGPVWGAFGALNYFKKFRCAMRIPNMCFVLKLDNGKGVSIADEQNHKVTEPSSTVLVI